MLREMSTLHSLKLPVEFFKCLPLHSLFGEQWQDETHGIQKEVNLVNAALEWDSGNQSSLLGFMKAQITYYTTF